MFYTKKEFTILGPSHATIGISFSLSSTLLLLDYQSAIFVALGAYIGSLLPDIDHPNSTITKIIPFSKIIAYCLSHRGITHSVLVPLLMAVGLIVWYKQNPNSIESFIFLPLVGLIMGYALHLLADWLTIAGIPIFSPFSEEKFRSPFPFKTGSITEYVIVFLTVLGCFLMIVW